MQSSEQLAAFRALCKANNLGKADVWQHKQSGNWIIGRAGIEKIQGLNNIQIGIELAAAGVDFAVVKAAASRTLERKKIKVESLGSANAKNSQVSYYAEMAEKRAKSRSILMLMGFYELGVYGEEEADEFKQSKNVGAPTLEDAEPAVAVVRQLVPVVKEVLPPAATEPTLSVTPEAAPTEAAAEAQKNKLVQLMASPLLDEDERKMLLAKPLDARPQEWLDSTSTKLEALLVERKDPKKNLEAARNQLRTVVARYATELGEVECKGWMNRAAALTAKPEELRADARRLLAHFTAVPA